MILSQSLFSFRFLHSTLISLAIFTAPTIFAQSESTPEDHYYRLSKGDHVSITVHDQSDLNTSQDLDEQGEIRMKYIDIIKLEGFTIREAEEILEREYVEQRYLRAPDITVQISGYSSKLVVVRGAVESPGLIELNRHPNGLDILRVISMAGGFEDVAKEKAVRIIREDSQGNTQIFTIDVSPKGIRKRTEPFIVMPNDIIEVDETTF